MSVDRMSSTLLFNGHKAICTTSCFESGEQSKAVTVCLYSYPVYLYTVGNVKYLAHIYEPLGGLKSFKFVKYKCLNPVPKLSLRMLFCVRLKFPN